LLWTNKFIMDNSINRKKSWSACFLYLNNWLLCSPPIIVLSYWIFPLETGILCLIKSLVFVFAKLLVSSDSSFEKPK
jgi:hypothetical protein